MDVHNCLDDLPIKISPNLPPEKEYFYTAPFT